MRKLELKRVYRHFRGVTIIWSRTLPGTPRLKRNMLEAIQHDDNIFPEYEINVIREIIEKT